MRPPSSLLSLRTARVFALFAVLAAPVASGCAGDYSEEEDAALPRRDAAVLDTGDPWGEPVDAGVPDTFVPDTFVPDAGPPDAGPDTALDCDDPHDFGSANDQEQLVAIEDDSAWHDRTGGVLNGTADTDAYVVYSDDTFQVGNPAPFAEAESAAANGQICIFITCVGGLANGPTCSQGSPITATINGASVPGCCNATPGGVHADYNCTGGDDDINLSIRMKATKNACLPYDFRYRSGN